MPALAPNLKFSNCEYSVKDNGGSRIKRYTVVISILRVSLPKTGPLRFGSENQFPLNFAHEYILVQK